MKLFRVGYGREVYNTVANSREEAIEKVKNEQNKAFLPFEVIDEITEVDGYKVLIGEGIDCALLQNCKDLLELQGKNGNWDSSEYMLGLFNGMETMVAILEGREPEIREFADAEGEKTENTTDGEKVPEEIEAQLDEKQLMNMKKDDLIKLATDMELQINEDMTKQDITNLIRAEKVTIDKENIVDESENN